MYIYTVHICLKVNVDVLEWVKEGQNLFLISPFKPHSILLTGHCDNDNVPITLNVQRVTLQPMMNLLLIIIIIKSVGS